MTLRTRAKVTKINRKSSSPCFKDLKIGDVIEFSIEIKRVGSSSRGTRAAYITCCNEQTGYESNLSFNQIGNILHCCELEEIENEGNHE